MSTKVEELPEQGEIVIATVTKIMDHGAYVSLDEYDGLQGFLHVSEIAPGWIRSVGRYVKEGEKKVLLVKKVRLERTDIDLSLKQVSTDQKKKKLLEVKRHEKGSTLIKKVQEKAKLSTGDIEKLEDALYSKYDSIYDAFMDIARNGISVIEELKVPKKAVSALEEISSKMKLPSVEIRGVLEISNKMSDGVEIIKNTLLDVMKDENGKNIQITYLGAPKYRLAITAQDFKLAEKIMKPVLEDIQQTIEKKKGTFKFTREESKKIRES
ncbi:MAG: S1 RNA-binding domain-containing protein [Thaumarchaeota archaeon]|nr:S1 RNA-binding domain-containing protein [Nitrososphaerota archaeon]GFN41396.1 MAG: eukaryotic translation initiation factor 2 alpha subunit [Marine Group I thaumarchaeote]